MMLVFCRNRPMWLASVSFKSPCSNLLTRNSCATRLSALACKALAAAGGIQTLHLGETIAHQACYIVAVLVVVLDGQHVLLYKAGHALAHAPGDVCNHLRAQLGRSALHGRACQLRADITCWYSGFRP